MAYDEGLAERVREFFLDVSFVSEKRMFGALIFMVNGNMCCGVNAEGLMVRVGPAAYADSLELPHAEPMAFTGKPLTGFISVTDAGVEDEEDLRDWLQRGLNFAGALPPKQGRPPRKKATRPPDQGSRHERH